MLGSLPLASLICIAPAMQIKPKKRVKYDTGAVLLRWSQK